MSAPKYIVLRRTREGYIVSSRGEVTAFRGESMRSPKSTNEAIVVDAEPSTAN